MSRLIVPITESDHRMGGSGSPVTLVEYGDYQCLTCRLSIPVMKQLKNELGDKLCFVFRHFPLKLLHPLAEMGAKAAEAASLQNKFWEMHELIFQNQLLLSPELFHQLAEQLHLNLPQFEADMRSPSLAEKIDADFNAALRSGVNGTPCFYINEERYDGDLSYGILKEALIQAAKLKSS